MTRFAKDSRLIFDLGMNNGDDTAFYLSRGYSVVALDANPALCERAQARFRAAIDDGRLKIVNAAIWEKDGQTSFYVNLDNDHWSSLDIGWAGRDATKCKEIVVQCVTLGSLFAEFGLPYYLKIDVEGVDQSVLEQLRGSDLLPLYVSVEDCRFGFQYMQTLAILRLRSLQAVRSIHRVADDEIRPLAISFRPAHRGRSATICRGNGCHMTRW